MEVAVVAVGCPLTEPVFTAAASAGHLEMCVWVLDRGCPRDEEEDVRPAATAGQVAVVRWLLQRDSDSGARSRLSETALVAAAGACNRALCEELLAVPGVEHIQAAVRTAAENGHLDLTSWLLQQLMARPGFDVENSGLLPSAAYGFPLPALQRLYHSRLGSEAAQRQAFNEEHGCQTAFAAFASPTPDWRAKLEWLDALGCRLGQRLSGFEWYQGLHGHLSKRPDAVERMALLRGRCGLNVQLCLRDAVRDASLPVLRYLRGEGLLAGQQRDHLWMHLAVASGNVAVMAELLAAGWRIRGSVPCSAASSGHLHVLQWMQGPAAGPAAAEVLQAALQDPELMARGATSGSLELMAWLRERGSPWDDGAFTSAAVSGNVALLEWMAAQGCPMPATGEPYLEAGYNDDFATLRCLRRLGCPWDPTGGATFTCAVYRDVRGCCSLGVLRWLVAEGCPVDWEAAKEQALRRGDDTEEVRAWIVSQEVAARDDGQ